MLTIRRTALIAARKAIGAGEEFDAESRRRETMFKHLRQARAQKLRVNVPQEQGLPTVRGLPEGVAIEPGRIEVRFEQPKQGMQRLYALAQALLNDYDTFEALAEERQRSG